MNTSLKVKKGLNYFQWTFEEKKTLRIKKSCNSAVFLFPFLGWLLLFPTIWMDSTFNISWHFWIVYDRWSEFETFSINHNLS